MGLLHELAKSFTGSVWSGPDVSAPEHTGDAGAGGMQEDVHAAAHWGVHAIASPRHYSHAAFLCTAGGSSSSSTGVAPESHAGTGDLAGPLFAHHRTSFAVQLQGIELGPVRTHLVYQSPEIYKTDISEHDKKIFGKPFDAKFEFDVAALPKPHPEIGFQKRHHKVHVHMVDKNTGDVFWDANYKIAMTPFGSKWLDTRTMPIPTNPGAHPIMRKFWIPEDDPGPHLFDLSISTRDNYFPDAPDTPYGDDEGFDNLYGHSAHIGVEAFRLPKLQKSEVLFPNAQANPYPHQEVEKVCNGRHGCSDAPVHHGFTERLRNKEEDPFIDPITNDDHRLYYGWMIERSGIQRNDYGYLFKAKDSPPLVLPSWMDYSKPRKPGKVEPQPGDDAANPVNPNTVGGVA